MPRKPTNYANTLIYKFVCKDLTITDIYVGHTTSFKDRKREHKSRCNNENDKKYNLKLYKTIRDNVGWENWEMIEIEKFPCNDANEARTRERYWYEELNAKLNARCPTENIESKKIRIKSYLKVYNKNLTKIQKENKLDYNKDWKSHIYICECGASILNACKTKHFKTLKHIKNS